MGQRKYIRITNSEKKRKGREKGKKEGNNGYREKVYKRKRGRRGKKRQKGAGEGCVPESQSMTCTAYKFICLIS